MDLDDDGDDEGGRIIFFPPLAIVLILLGIGLVVLAYYPELIPLALSFIPQEYPQQIRESCRVESSVFLFSGIGCIIAGSSLLAMDTRLYYREETGIYNTAKD